jgi:tetratricopeptide (TPR) repeat protein
LRRRANFAGVITGPQPFSTAGSTMRFSNLTNRQFLASSALVVVLGVFVPEIARGQEATAEPAADTDSAAETSTDAAPATEGEQEQRTPQEVVNEIWEKRNEIATQGSQALQKGDFPAALQLFDQLAQAGEILFNSSGFTQAYEQVKHVGMTGRGQALAGMKEYEAALEEFNKVLETNPDFVPTLLARGRMFLDLENPENYATALSDFQKAVKAQRNNLLALFGLGKVLVLTNNFQAGVSPLSKVIAAVEADTQNLEANRIQLAEAYRLRGVGYAGVYKMKEASDDLNKSLALNPNDHETYLTLGALAFRDERFQEAVDLFGKSIDHYKPKDPEDKLPFVQGLLTRANTYIEMGKKATDAQQRSRAYQAAKQEVEKILVAVDPKNPFTGGVRAQSLYTRGIAERMAGDLEQAVQTLSEAIELNPEFSEAYYRRGICYHYLGDDRLAIADFTEASSINFNDPRSALWLGFTHAKMGNYLDALRAYNDAIAVSDRFTPAYINRGLAYMALGEYEKALSDFNDAVRLEPTNSDYYFKRGLAYEALGQYDKAGESFADAIEFNDKHTAAYRHLSEAMQRLGRTELATQYRQRATELEASKNTP